MGGSDVSRTLLPADNGSPLGAGQSDGPGAPFGGSAGTTGTRPV